MSERAKLSIKGPLLIVSDVHIKEPGSDQGHLFLQLLTEVENRSIHTLLFLGDIFDFILGSTLFYQQKFADIGLQLERIARAGTRVIFTEGNHEFSMKKLPWVGVEFLTNRSNLFELDDGTIIMSGHGDDILPPWKYSVFRYVVKSNVFLSLFSLLPSRVIDFISLKSSAVSRAQDRYRFIDHDRILEAANLWSERSLCNHAVFGHFHVPYAVERRKGQGKLLSFDCWEASPSALLYSNGTFMRWRISLGVDGKLEIAETGVDDQVRR